MLLRGDHEQLVDDDEEEQEEQEMDPEAAAELKKKRDDARDGETVVAILENNEATLKRFYRKGRRFRLQPANAALKPQIVDKVEIRGVVVGVVRSY